MLTELIDLLEKLENDIGNGVRVNVRSGVQEGRLEFKLDWPNDFRMLFEFERTSRGLEALVYEAKNKYGRYVFEKQKGINHEEMARMQRSFVCAHEFLPRPPHGYEFCRYCNAPRNYGNYK